MPEGPAAATALPIEAQLPTLITALTDGATVLLQAPPGAGKTTRVPLALLEALPGGRILMLEPRRLATRAAAERLASLLAEPVGRQVGYRVRLDARLSAQTRLEVVTSGVFLRLLQDDPALEGVSCVIFDEFHERHSDTDLALALLRQARSLLRPELRLLLMSATLDVAPLAEQLDGARLISSEGRSHPVSVCYQPPRPREALQNQVLRALESAWLGQHRPGETALIFLPGQREIERCRQAIAASAWGNDLDCVPLHGQLSLEAQSQAIRPCRHPHGRLVLATSIAESSLTIDGVSLVIDAGLCRRSRFDPNTGMEALITVPASQASAEQRRGRAGRQAPGRCLRLWSPAEQQRRPAHTPAELLEADPLPIALELARWGAGGGEDLPWLDPPPAAALAEAWTLLLQLQAVDPQQRITAHGVALSRLALHPRLGHMLLLADRRGWLETASAVAVLLSERDPLDRREAGCDLMRRLDWLSTGVGSGPPQTQQQQGPRQRQWRQLQAQLCRQVRAAGGSSDGVAPESARQADVAQMLAWAYPERLALARGRQAAAGRGRFLMRGGRGASIHPEDPLAEAEALAIAGVDDQGQDARVLLAVAAPRTWLEGLAEEQGEPLQRTFWDPLSERVRCEQGMRLGALELAIRPWSDPDPAAVQAALLEGIRQLGDAALPWCPRSRDLQQRLVLAHRHLGAPWPDRRPEQLRADPAAWLAGWLEGCRSRQDLQALDLCDALWGDLPWSLRQVLERLLPSSWTVPSGRAVRLDYSSGEPVLAVKLQELFGCRSTPCLLDGRLPLTVQLLSPAGRPCAVTRDLGGFWDHGYREVRRELRGRYPKHPWPEDPHGAMATSLSNAALQRQTRGGGCASPTQR
ncbi:MAG: ATP-dependent helicase HrpB [Synechococcaceae cyanobacterium]|nr:ATP-dependent helicase HrpB [Synechococcaceae cyanobacterium]